MENYTQIQKDLQKYCFEKLKNNKKPMDYLEELKDKNPTMIENAVKPKLITAAIIYSYLRRNKLNGKNGITIKDLAEYFNVGKQGVSSKVFDVDCVINTTAIFPEDELYEFIDIDRFEISEEYYNFLEDPVADNYIKSEKILKNMIKQDPYFFDPYTALYEYYLNKNEIEKAFNLMSKGYKNAIQLIEKNGEFPNILRWGFVENRHIIRVIFNFATLLWLADKKDDALDILIKLYKSNLDDNIGARYSILAILEGIESQKHLEKLFDSGDGYSNWEKQEEWSELNRRKYVKIINF